MIDAAIRETERQEAERKAAVIAAEQKKKEDEAARIAAKEKAALAVKAEADRKAQEAAARVKAERDAKEVTVKEAAEKEAMMEAKRKAKEEQGQTEAEWRKWVDTQRWMKKEVIGPFKAGTVEGKSKAKSGMRLMTRGLGQVTNSKSAIVRTVCSRQLLARCI
jgi:membrane protein involved in colicin uptake